METLRNQLLRLDAPRVLNAFRHHGWKHEEKDQERDAYDRAQRLSASWMETPGCCGGVGDGCGCSTPFGIMDGNTMRAFRIRGEKYLCSTPFGIMDGNTCILESVAAVRSHGAQRLSASWMETLGTVPYSVVGETRAQRLSASWMETHNAGSKGNWVWDVLNAFRHHGWKHGDGEPVKTAPAGAQRLSASWMETQATRVK